MIIKSFTAESASAALKKVRSEMGGDAVVLKTREIKESGGGNRVEITACLDKPSAAQASAIFPDRQSEPVLKTTPDVNERLSRFEIKEGGEPEKQPDIYERLAAIENRLTRLASTDTTGMPTRRFDDGVRQNIYENLKNADLPENYIETLFERTGKIEPDMEKYSVAFRDLLTADLAEIIQPGFTYNSSEKAVFFGPPASGKTSVIGKTAARLVVKKKKVRLVSLDNLKVGAFEEINSYADLLGLEMTDVSATKKEKKKTEEILLVDTPAVPLKEDQRTELRNKIETLKPDYRVLVLSALQRTADVADLLASLKEFNPTHLVMTMTDLTRRCGALVPVCRELGVKLAFITDAPGGIGRLEAPDIEAIIGSLLNEEVNLEQA